MKKTIMLKPHSIIHLIPFILILLLITPSPSQAYHPCGSLLPSITSYCANPLGGTPLHCCWVLQIFSDNLCWCEPSSTSFITTLAGNEYGYVWRQHACDAGMNTTGWKHGAFGGSRGVAGIKSTCPKSFVSVGEEVCKGKMLRMGRMGNVGRWNGVEGVGGVEKVVDDVFVEEGRVVVVGLGEFYGKEEIGEFLKSRLVVAGWDKGDGEIFNVFWRKAAVSYQMPSGRVEFVEFEDCGTRIKEVVVGYRETYFAKLLSQYLYKGEGGMLDEYTGTKEEWCKVVGERCKGELNPFGGLKGCTSKFGELIKGKRVTCNGFQENSTVPVNAWAGDSVACRAFYINLAKVNPVKYCPMIVDGGGKCKFKACPAMAYTDVFKQPNPRYPGSGLFACSDTGCEEDWP